MRFQTPSKKKNLNYDPTIHSKSWRSNQFPNPNPKEERINSINKPINKS